MGAFIALLVGCSDGGRASINDLRFPNPDDIPGVTGVHRFAVEWRVMGKGEPIPCGDATWVGGCTYFDTIRSTCVVYAENPLEYPAGSDHESRLAILGHEILHCVFGGFHKNG